MLNIIKYNIYDTYHEKYCEKNDFMIHEFLMNNYFPIY